jgi:hypothetical protein
MTYKFSLTREEYIKLRYVSMRGGFEHEFEQNGSTVKVKTRYPQTLVKDLEKLFPADETSWSEILDIK